MLASTKQVIIYGAFGLLLGAKIVEVLLTGGAGLLDWWLLIIGLAAAIVHYLPEQKNAADQPPREHYLTDREAGHDTLVLRDHSDPERSDRAPRYPESVDRRVGRR